MKILKMYLYQQKSDNITLRMVLLIDTWNDAVKLAKNAIMPSTLNVYLTHH